MKISVKNISPEQLRLVKQFEFLRDTFRLRFYERATMWIMLWWLKHLQLSDGRLAIAESMYDDVKKSAKKRGRR
jgi:hypothetical protein